LKRKLSLNIYYTTQPAITFCTNFGNIITMPIITVAMYSGRTQREKDRLAEAITDDIVKILNIPKTDVIVVIQEASHGNWYSSGIRL
jgi:4-oxalocrotonate tautomerase